MSWPLAEDVAVDVAAVDVEVARGASGSGTVVSPNFTTALLETTRPICGNTAIVAPLRGVNSAGSSSPLREIRRRRPQQRIDLGPGELAAFTVHLPLTPRCTI